MLKEKRHPSCFIPAQGPAYRVFPGQVCRPSRLRIWGGRNQPPVAQGASVLNAHLKGMWCLRGEEREECRQRLINKYMHKLFFWLDEGRHDLASLQAAERIIKTIVPDGNYLYLNDDLMHNYIWQAGWYAREERFEEAIKALTTAHQYAIAFDTVKEKVKEQAIYFTSPILNKLKFDSNTLSTSGTSTMTEDFVEYLSWGWFDTMREREDFKALYNL